MLGPMYGDEHPNIVVTERLTYFTKDLSVKYTLAITPDKKPWGTGRQRKVTTTALQTKSRETTANPTWAARDSV